MRCRWFVLSLPCACVGPISVDHDADTDPAIAVDTDTDRPVDVDTDSAGPSVQCTQLAAVALCPEPLSYDDARAACAGVILPLVDGGNVADDLWWLVDVRVPAPLPPCPARSSATGEDVTRDCAELHPFLCVR